MYLLGKYRKQQKLHERKLLQFLWIFDESRKFSLLIDFAVKDSNNIL